MKSIFINVESIPGSTLKEVFDDMKKLNNNLKTPIVCYFNGVRLYVTQNSTYGQIERIFYQSLPDLNDN